MRDKPQALQGRHQCLVMNLWLYVLLFPARMCHTALGGGTGATKHRYGPGHRETTLCWPGLPLGRHAHGCFVGQGCMGSLLELGSQGVMGRCHMGIVPHCHPFSPECDEHLAPMDIPCHHPAGVRGTADVLVWRQLPALGSDKCAYL